MHVLLSGLTGQRIAGAFVRCFAQIDDFDRLSADAASLAKPGLNPLHKNYKSIVMSFTTLRLARTADDNDHAALLGSWRRTVSFGEQIMTSVVHLTSSAI